MRDNLKRLRGHEMLAAPKTNGTRSYLLLMKIDNNRTPSAFVINRRLQMMLLPGIGPMERHHVENPILNGKEDPFALFDGSTLLDGDIVQQHKTGRYLFVPHDFICADGSNLPYEQRLSLLEEMFRERLLHCSNACPFELRQKPIVSMRRLRWLMTEYIPKLDYSCDGSTLSRKDGRIETGTSQTIFKWKHWLEHTTELTAAIKIVTPSQISNFVNNVPANIVTEDTNARDIMVQFFMSGGPNRLAQPITQQFLLCEQNIVDTLGRALCVAPPPSLLGTQASLPNAPRFMQDMTQSIAWEDASNNKIPWHMIRHDSVQHYCNRMHGQVCEFYFDRSNNQYKYRNIREDKSVPNTYRIVAFTQENVREAIQPQELWKIAEATAVAEAV